MTNKKPPPCVYHTQNSCPPQPMLSASGGRRRPLTRLKPIHHSEALRVLDLGDSNMPHGVGGEGSVESGVTAAGAAAGFRAPLCKVCCENGATVFCRNDSAWLCDACDAAVHLSNPLSACHEILPLNSYLLQQVRTYTYITVSVYLSHCLQVLRFAQISGRYHTKKGKRVWYLVVVNHTLDSPGCLPICFLGPGRVWEVERTE